MYWQILTVGWTNEGWEKHHYNRKMSIQKFAEYARLLKYKKKKYSNACSSRHRILFIKIHNEWFHYKNVLKIGNKVVSFLELIAALVLKLAVFTDEIPWLNISSLLGSYYGDNCNLKGFSNCKELIRERNNSVVAYDRCLT